MKRLEHSWSKVESAMRLPITRINSQRSSFRTKILSSSASSRRISILNVLEHPIIAADLIKLLFKAKCEDMDIPNIPDQEARFFALSRISFKDRTFCLSDSNLKEKSALVISQILKTQNFAYVDLSRNSLGDKGTKVLMHQLKNCNSIVHLNLSNNEISPEGFIQVLTYLTLHPSLISLDISSYEGLKRNRLSPQGAETLKKLLTTNNTLQILSISNISLSEGIELLSEGLANNFSLVSLDISKNFIEGKYIENLCKGLVNSQVQKLNLSSNKIGDKGSKFLAFMLSNGYQKYFPLMNLDISENCITGKGAVKVFQALQFNNIIEEFSIHSNNFGSSLPVFISSFFFDNCGLSKINLSNCEINGRSLMNISDGLSKNKRLVSLNLSKNSIGDEGLKYLAPGLGKNKKLNYIDLSFCYIRDEGIDILIKCLRNNSTLNSISLKSNNLKDLSGERFLNLSRFNKHLENINLELNPISQDLLISLKSQLRTNKAHKKAEVIPKILTEIAKIKAPIVKFEHQFSEKKKKLEKKKNLEQRRLATTEMLTEVKIKEKKLTDQMKSELMDLKNQGLAKSVYLEDLKSETIVTIM